MTRRCDHDFPKRDLTVSCTRCGWQVDEVTARQVLATRAAPKCLPSSWWPEGRPFRPAVAR